jgi:hypothetical protein
MMTDGWCCRRKDSPLEEGTNKKQTKSSHRLELAKLANHDDMKADGSSKGLSHD